MNESKPASNKPGVESGSVNLQPKLCYSPVEAAAMLGVCRDTIYRLLKRGLLRSSSALRHKVIPHAEIERFLTTTLE